jgi:hypothetical protein
MMSSELMIDAISVTFHRGLSEISVDENLMTGSMALGTCVGAFLGASVYPTNFGYYNDGL